MIGSQGCSHGMALLQLRSYFVHFCTRSDRGSSSVTRLMDQIKANAFGFSAAAAFLTEAWDDFNKELGARLIVVLAALTVLSVGITDEF